MRLTDKMLEAMVVALDAALVEGGDFDSVSKRQFPKARTWAKWERGQRLAERRRRLEEARRKRKEKA